MEVPSLVKKKSIKKKVDDEPTQWQCRLGRDVRYNIRLLEVIKPFVDTFMASQGQRAFNGPTDRAIHPRDVFAPVNPSTRSPIIRDPSDQPGMSYKKFIMKGKSKGVAGPIEGPKDDQH
ncbi:hypothetical protein GOBAR_DD08173 [Gossypium barbadense]|nr:hypothetical protein GOBAR_DD08173 [Gossypium barbadense]